MRVEVEALSYDAWKLHTTSSRGEGGQHGYLKVVGKGGHERLIPISSRFYKWLEDNTLSILEMRRLSYSAHLKQWNAACERAGFPRENWPTPHDLRRDYAHRVYEGSNSDLVLVQRLLGHASPKTTSEYIRLDTLSKGRKALGYDG